MPSVETWKLIFCAARCCVSFCASPDASRCKAACSRCRQAARRKSQIVTPTSAALTTSKHDLRGGEPAKKGQNLFLKFFHVSRPLRTGANQSLHRSSWPYPSVQLR